MACSILFVDDDLALRATLVEHLAIDGEFTTDAVGSAAGAEMLLGADHARYAAILLDVGLPDGMGTISTPNSAGRAKTFRSSC